MAPYNMLDATGGNHISFPCIKFVARTCARISCSIGQGHHWRFLFRGDGFMLWKLTLGVPSASLLPNVYSSDGETMTSTMMGCSANLTVLIGFR